MAEDEQSHPRPRFNKLSLCLPRLSLPPLSIPSYQFHSILSLTQNDMAASTCIITFATFLSGKTSSLPKPSLTASSALRFPVHCTHPIPRCRVEAGHHLPTEAPKVVAGDAALVGVGKAIS
ncbi:hypothetical protein ABKV19_009165 [Rosa sericea]